MKVTVEINDESVDFLKAIYKASFNRTKATTNNELINYIQGVVDNCAGNVILSDEEQIVYKKELTRLEKARAKKNSQRK